MSKYQDSTTLLVHGHMLHTSWNIFDFIRICFWFLILWKLSVFQHYYMKKHQNTDWASGCFFWGGGIPKTKYKNMGSGGSKKYQNFGVPESWDMKKSAGPLGARLRSWPLLFQCSSVFDVWLLSLSVHRVWWSSVKRVWSSSLGLYGLRI